MDGTLTDYLKLSARTGTFVSIDVVSSTILKSGENEEDIIYTFLSYHRLITDTAYQHHGTVMTISGDGMMCRFEKAEDAATAIFAILSSIPEFNKRHNRLRKPFAIRIGAHTGEVLEAESLSSGQIISHTLDIAAKLQQSAPNNHARFSESTITLLPEKPATLSRVGWDTNLNVNVFQYQDTRVTSSVPRHIPNPFKILVVENELDELMRLRRLCFEQRLQCLPTFDAAQAMFCTTHWKPHMILISAELAWNSGWEFLKTLRGTAEWGGIPVLMLSVNTSGQTLERCFRLGGNGCINKPLENQQTLKRLEMVMREFFS